MLDVLDVIVAQERPTTRNAIAAALGAPRSTVYRMIDTLVARGYADQIEPEGLIVPGRRCGLLGLAYERSSPLMRQARDVVAHLATATGEVAELDVLQDWKQLILISRSGRGITYRGAAEGTRLPLPWTASGRFLLEGCTKSELRESIPPADFVLPGGHRSSAEALHREIGQAKEKGSWIAKGLIDPYLACITAPVRNRGTRCVGVICLVVPLPELKDQEQIWVKMVCRAADELSELCALSVHSFFGGDGPR